MPYYRRRRNNPSAYAKKRRYNRYNRKGSNRNTMLSKVVDLSTGIPDRLMTKLVYTDQYFLQSAGGSAGALQVMRGNSIFDPDQSGSGTQPLGRDQWANFYNYYKVHASKIEVTAFSTGSLDANLQVLTVAPEISVPSAAFNAIDAAQHPYAKTIYIGTSTGGSSVRKLTNFMSTKKLFGRTNLDDDDFKSLMSANPTDQFYWRVQAIPVDESSAFNLRVMVKVTYYVELVERVTLQNS